MVERHTDLEAHVQSLQRQAKFRAEPDSLPQTFVPKVQDGNPLRRRRRSGVLGGHRWLFPEFEAREKINYSESDIDHVRDLQQESIFRKESASQTSDPNLEAFEQQMRKPKHLAILENPIRVPRPTLINPKKNKSN